MGSDADGIYLVGFQIKTNAPTKSYTYSPYSAFYLRKVTVIYDKAFTDEQIENNLELMNEFSISHVSEAEIKARVETAEKNRLKKAEAELMAND